MTDSSKAEIFLEFKWKSDDDPFCKIHDVRCPKCKDRNFVNCLLCKGHKYVKSFFHETKSATNTLGQITAYASAQLGSQFRTHIYSIFVMKYTARIIRWDRERNHN